MLRTTQRTFGMYSTGPGRGEQIMERPSTPARAIRLILGVALAGAVCSPARLGAQVAGAVIEVAAVDETAGVLPGVTVTLTRPDTGIQQIVITDSAGLARGVALPPGIYDIRFELSGFTTVVEKGLTVRVGQTARVTATLKVAQVAETITVVGEAGLVDVFKTDSSTNIVPEQIESL